MTTAATQPKLRTMPYVRLGKSGLKVSKIILGAMSYGHKGWEPWVIDDQAEVTRHIKFAYDAGINTFDTANLYSNGLSEVMLGTAIKQLALPREEIVVMTKVWSVVASSFDTPVMENFFDQDSKGYVNQHGLSRKHIFDSVKHSLDRLQLDYIDLFQCHRFDDDIPIEETMQALHDVVKAGYVRYIGMSSCWAWQFNAMQNYAIQNHLTPFISMQNHYNLVYREEEREMFPSLKYFGVGSIPWSPLARGLVTRPLKDQTERGSVDLIIRSYTQAGGTAEIIKRIEEVASKKNLSMAQVAVAWVLGKDGVTAPIVGTTKLKNLQDIIGAIQVDLTKEEMNYLEEPYKPQGIVGHGENFLVTAGNN